MRRRLYVAIVSTFLVSVTFAKSNNDLQEWVQAHLHHGEELICERAVNNDYFFVARKGDQIKSGYRIDVTSTSGTPDTFVISWRFLDELKNHLGLASDPEIIAQGYKRSGGRMFAEEIAYRSVSLGSSGILHVNIWLKKYDTVANSPVVRHLAEDELEQIFQCEVTLQ